MVNEVANNITKRIQHMLSLHEKESVALHEPCFRGNEWKYVKECIDTGWVSSVGKFVTQFEQDLANFTGVQHAIATSNGTSALHMCYLVAGVTPGDEVLVPTMTFVATINALSYCHAIPHFIDSEEENLGINPVLLDEYLQNVCEIKNNTCINRTTGRVVRALCVMHTLGHPVDLDPLLELCQKYHLTLIEDAAEALGSYYKGKHVGHHGLLSALSFNGNKILTTGGGGAIITQDAKLAKRAKHLTTTAKLPHPWLFDHDEVGYNYRLPNINAALGCAQLEQLPDFLCKKRMLAETYQQLFANDTALRVLSEPSHSRSNYWLNALLLPSTSASQRDTLLETLNKNGIMARPLWTLQHTLPMYRACPRMPLPVAESVAERLIKLPSSPQLVMKKSVPSEHAGVY